MHDAEAGRGRGHHPVVNNRTGYADGEWGLGVALARAGAAGAVARTVVTAVLDLDRAAIRTVALVRPMVTVPDAEGVTAPGPLPRANAEAPPLAEALKPVADVPPVRPMVTVAVGT